jgi:excisionase family DNA binding protein
MLNGMLTVKDLARRWNVSRSWVYRQVHYGSLPYYRPSARALRFDGFEAETWLEEHHHNKRKQPMKRKV